MTGTARLLLASLLITLHASIAVVGASLHAAPGLAHSGPSRVGEHPHGDGGLVQADSEAPEHCPICDHCSQGQLTPRTAATPACSRVAPLEPAALRPAALRPPALAARPRAPPSGGVRTS